MPLGFRKYQFICVWSFSITVSYFVILTLDFELMFVSSQAEKMLRVFVNGELLYKDLHWLMPSVQGVPISGYI